MSESRKGKNSFFFGLWKHKIRGKRNLLLLELSLGKKGNKFFQDSESFL